MSNEKDWYENNIEPEIRELVCILRNNGFNTECSCGHKMYIQCQYILDQKIMELHKLLSDYLYENKKPINYNIEVLVRVREGHQYPTLNIELNPTS